MNFESLRPRLFRLQVRLVAWLRRDRSLLVLGRRCRFERSASIKLGKRTSLRLGDKVVLRGGCVLDLGRQGNLMLADQVEVRHYAIIECGGRVSIGRRSVIGVHNWLQGSGQIDIGDDVIIGPGVRIISTTHDISDPDQPFSCQPLIAQPVQIGSNVWIGADVIILGGVRVGKNVVIGAGSLVNHDLDDGGVYVGTPARRVKELHSNL